MPSLPPPVYRPGKAGLQLRSTVAYSQMGGTANRVLLPSSSRPKGAPPVYRPAAQMPPSPAVYRPGKPVAQCAKSWADLAKNISPSDFNNNNAAPQPKTLKQKILDDLDGWEKQAKAKLSTASGNRTYPGDQMTVCFMWKSSTDYRYAISGGGGKSLTPGKEKVCAEDVLLNENGKDGWKYSLSYDNVNGWKKACSNGCSKLLENLKIEDLKNSF